MPALYSATEMTAAEAGPTALRIVTAAAPSPVELLLSVELEKLLAAKLPRRALPYQAPATMPAYRFSWDPFDNDTCSALARAIGYLGNDDAARDYLATHVKRPDDDFIGKCKGVLAQIWLPKHRAVGESIVRELFDRNIGGRGPMPTDAKGFAEYIDNCRNSSGVRDLLFQRLVGFGDQDRIEEGESLSDDFVPRFGSVKPSKQGIQARSPYPHQVAAWKELDAHSAEAKASGVFKGVLVMPTGSGKTETAVNWLLRNWVNDGRRVLWLAHREELLRQAARTFYRQSGLASKRDSLRVRLVSSRHCRFHQIDPADDVICCSVHSLARAGREAKGLLEDENLFVVIDEAHHAPAKSYRDAIHALEAARSHRLLGLTATPTRTAERERPELAKLFGRRTLYQVKAAELIARELLARPIPVSTFCSTRPTFRPRHCGSFSGTSSCISTFNRVTPQSSESSSSVGQTRRPATANSTRCTKSSVSSIGEMGAHRLTAACSSTVGWRRQYVSCSSGTGAVAAIELQAAMISSEAACATSRCITSPSRDLSSGNASNSRLMSAWSVSALACPFRAERLMTFIARSSAGSTTRTPSVSR